MFTITKLTLFNICQYDAVTIPIEQGLMAVCGKNGSGKTTLLRALMYGLTGLVDGSWGSQQSLQKDGTTVPGYVEVSFTDLSDGTTYMVRRYATAGPKFPDVVYDMSEEGFKEVATRRKTVDAYLTDCFGIAPSLLFQLCWGRQGQLDMLLTAPAAYITTFLSSIFEVKHLETLRTRLKGEIDSIAGIADPMPEISKLAEEKLLLERSLPDLENAFQDAQKAHTDAVTHESAMKVKSQSEDLVRARELAQLKVEERRCDAQVKHEFEVVRGFLIKGTHDELWAKSEAQEAPLKAKEQEIAALDDEENDLKSRLAEVVRVRDTTAQVLLSLQSNKEAFELLDPGIECTCKLCGKVLDDTSSYLNKVQQICGYDEQEISRVQDQHDRAERDYAQIASRIREIDDLLYRKKVEANNIRDLRGNLARSAAYMQHVESLQKNRERQRELEAAGCSQDDLNELRDATRAREECSRQLHDTSEQLSAAKARITVIDGILDRLEQEKEQYEINTEARKLLTTLRDVFSQQRAQARYFASKITMLNDRLAEFMEFTEMPFSLRLNPDTRTFEYTSSDGFVHPACHLSGAQKNISSVALQMALVEVVQQNINLFLFDEPSEALDVENKYVMAEMFKRMNRMLPSIGGTMLIVSRDEQLIESCENVININKEESENG